MSRPEKINEKIETEIINMIKTGNYLETAAAYAGIDVSTIRRWIKRGEREIQRTSKKSSKIKVSERKYVEFCTAIKKAKAESEIRDLLIIGTAAKTDWKASAWRLERKYPERWGKKERHEVTGKDGGKIEIDMEDPREILKRKLDEIAKRYKEEE